MLFLGSEPFMIHKTRYVDLDMENFRKYGKVWGSYSMSEPWINVSDPELIKVNLRSLIIQHSYICILGNSSQKL